MYLHPEQRSKLDPSEDGRFYDLPRFVTHVDEGFIQQLTQLYRDRLSSLHNHAPPSQMRILDLMSSWVSHLPAEMSFAHVEGHGLNSEELAQNPRLDHFFVQDLNQNPRLNLPNQSFDAVLNAVSVQYLQYPEAIFSEIYRVLKPGGVAMISFSNRMFFQKAIQVWRDSSESERIELVKQYFQAVPGFSSPEVITRPGVGGLLSWFNPTDPFYAVLAYRP